MAETFDDPGSIALPSEHKNYSVAPDRIDTHEIPPSSGIFCACDKAIDQKTNEHGDKFIKMILTVIYHRDKFTPSPANTGNAAEMPGVTRTLFNNEQLHSAGRERSLAHSKAGASLSAAVSTSVRRRATTHLKQNNPS